MNFKGLIMVVCRTYFVLCSVFSLALASAVSLNAQETQSKADATLVVTGKVKEVFRSPRQGKIDYLIQLDVLRSEGLKALPAGSQLRFPGPGETVYVHVSQKTDPAGRLIPKASHQDLPEEQAEIKAYLKPRDQGGWEGVFPEWMETTAPKKSEPKPEVDAVPDIFGDSAPTSSTAGLGMTTEVIRIQKQIGLKVTSVERGGPAQKAGLEVGDIIAGVDKAPITDARQLETMAAKGKKFSLIVVDVNTGRGAQIEIDPTVEAAVAEAEEKPTPAPANPKPQAAPEPSSKVSLGISAEPVTLGSRSALKVTRVDPAGLAAKAGIEVNDVIVAANGIPTTGAEQLLGALRKSGPTLTLTVRDSRSGRDTPVEVSLTGSKPNVPEKPIEVETPLGTPTGKLGAVTELAFHDDDFAVKITEVEPGSAAARAGLKPGLLVISANGKPVLHPNDLNDIARKGGNLKLTVVEPNSGKKANVDVNLSK